MATFSSDAIRVDAGPDEEGETFAEPLLLLSFEEIRICSFFHITMKKIGNQNGRLIDSSQ